MSDTIRIKAGVECSFTIAKTGNVYEVPREEWEAMTDAEREQTLDDYAQGELENSVNAFAYVLEDEG